MAEDQKIMYHKTSTAGSELVRNMITWISRIDLGHLASPSYLLLATYTTSFAMVFTGTNVEGQTVKHRTSRR
jgi:hypothetical protein